MAVMRLYDPTDYSQEEYDLNMDKPAYYQIYNEIDKLIPETIISNIYTVHRAPNAPTNEWFDLGLYLFQETLKCNDDHSKLDPTINSAIARGYSKQAVKRIASACSVLYSLIYS